MQSISFRYVLLVCSCLWVALKWLLTVTCMVSFGDSKHKPVKPLHRLLCVTPLILALSAKCTIHDVTNWPLFIKVLIIILLHRSVSVLEREGLEGSFGIFGL